MPKEITIGGVDKILAKLRSECHRGTTEVRELKLEVESLLRDWKKDPSPDNWYELKMKASSIWLYFPEFEL